MATLPPELQAEAAREFRALRRHLCAGVAEANHKARRKCWQHWKEIAISRKVDPCLEGTPNEQKIVLILAFAERIREGICGRRKRVRVGTAQLGLRAIGTTFALAGRPNPLHEDANRHIAPLHRLIEGMKREDPPTQPKLAVPPTVPEFLMNVGKFTTNNNASKQKAIGDLSVIAFYYLLRVGEHTFQTKNSTHECQRRRTRTMQFRARDVTFRRNGNIIPNNVNLQTLLSADEATLCISNQKNGSKGQLIHHQAFNGEDCPMKALARRVNHIMCHTTNQQTMLGTHFDKNNTKHHLISDDMNKAVQFAVKHLNMHDQGFNSKNVGSHSPRAGGAMAAKLNGIDRDTIKKMGRWSSDTFLMCIHEQIAHLSHGVAQKMSTRLPFRNIAPVTLIEPAAASA